MTALAEQAKSERRKRGNGQFLPIARRIGRLPRIWDGTLAVHGTDIACMRLLDPIRRSPSFPGSTVVNVREAGRPLTCAATTGQGRRLVCFPRLRSRGRAELSP